MNAAEDSLLDLVELRDSARKVLSDSRERAESPAALWSTVVSLGWLGIGVAADKGGLGQPFEAVAVLYEEMGRVLARQSFMSTTACLQTLAEGGAGAAALVREALQGDAIVADGTRALPAITQRSGRLHGTIAQLPDVDRATHLLVRCDAEHPRLLSIALPHPSVRIVQRATWDESRTLSDVHLVGAEAVLLATDNDALSISIRLAAHADLALACDSLGGAEEVFELTLRYLLQRQQFKRPIASFQAIKHRCADLATALAGARSLLGATARQFGQRTGDWRTAAAACRLHVGAVYREVSEEAVQLHGGIGFTWAYPCHRFLKRARCSDALDGTPKQRKDAVAAALFLAARREAAT